MDDFPFNSTLCRVIPDLRVGHIFPQIFSQSCFVQAGISEQKSNTDQRLAKTSSQVSLSYHHMKSLAITPMDEDHFLASESILCLSLIISINKMSAMIGYLVTL